MRVSKATKRQTFPFNVEFFINNMKTSTITVVAFNEIQAHYLAVRQKTHHDEKDWVTGREYSVSIRRV